MNIKSFLQNKTNLILLFIILIETIFGGVMLWSRFEKIEKNLVSQIPQQQNSAPDVKGDAPTQPAYPDRIAPTITLESDGFTKFVLHECIAKEGTSPQKFTYFLPPGMKFKETNQTGNFDCAPFFYGAEMESYYFPIPTDSNRFPVVRFTHPYDGKQSVVYAEKSASGGYDIKALVLGTKNIITVDHVEKLRMVYSDAESKGEYWDYNVVNNKYVVYASDKKVFVKDIENNKVIFTLDNLPAHRGLSYSFSSDFKNMAFVTDKGLKVNDGNNETFIYTDKPVQGIIWYQGDTDVDVSTFVKDYDKTKIYFVLEESNEEQDDLYIPIYSIDWDGKNFTKTKNSQYLGW